MKKVLFLLFFSLIITGCHHEVSQDNGEKTNLQEEKNMSEEKRTIEGQIDLAKEYKQVVMKTNLGDIKLKLYAEDSPITVNNFLNLSKNGFYDGTKFHRIISDFMIQGGDPNTRNDDWMTHGTGGPDYRFEDEFNNHKIVRGSLAMANAGPGTNGSQFFIVTAVSTPHLDGMHTNFGEVVEGMDIVDKIEAVETNERDHPIEDVEILGIELIK
jgi:peptidyl-prolyl cis-trans isomerase B (cyclophilin B)